MPRPGKRAPNQRAEQPRLPSPCPACGESLQAAGMCVACQAYFSPEPPGRRCGACAHPLDLGGYCWSCQEYRGPRLDLGSRRGISAWVVRGQQGGCAAAETRRGVAAARAAAGVGPDGRKLTVPERLEALQRMTLQQPGVGWEEALEELTMTWATRPPTGRGPDVAGALGLLPLEAGG